MADDKKIIFSMVGVGKLIPPSRQILKDIYLSFFYGAKIGIIGLNGSGKSSLLKIIAGVDKDYQGEVVFSPGYSVGYLEQEPRLDDSKTVRETVQEAVQPIVDALKEYEEVNNKFADPDADFDKLCERQGELTELLDHIERADKDDIFTMDGKQGMKMDIPEIPELLIDNTDRNRTSPFAFTGNRFEFRAVGSEANCASAMIALNSAVAEALADFKKRVDARIPEFNKQLEGTGHSATFHAIIDVLREDIKTCKPIRFDGNGYSDEWVLEAEKRGLDVEKSCPRIFERYLDAESIRMFESLGVMTKKELEARNEVKWETYTKKIQIEARVLGDLSMNHIIPVATRYQSALLHNVEDMSTIFPVDKAEKLSARNIKLIEEIAERTSAIEKGVEELVNARKLANKIAGVK